MKKSKIANLYRVSEAWPGSNITVNIHGYISTLARGVYARSKYVHGHNSGIPIHIGHGNHMLDSGPSMVLFVELSASTASFLPLDLVSYPASITGSVSILRKLQAHANGPCK